MRDTDANTGGNGRAVVDDLPPVICGHSVQCLSA
jgi:hypothetical protein